MCFLCLLQGLASCFGICAINHLEETLAKLEDFVRSDVFKKSVGLFSIFKVRAKGPLLRRGRQQKAQEGFFRYGVCWSGPGDGSSFPASVPLAWGWDTLRLSRELLLASEAAWR